MLALFAVACVAVPPSVSLGPGTPAEQRVERAVWLAPVSIRNGTAPMEPAIQGAMMLSLQAYLEQTGRFRSVRTLPGVPEPGDLVLQFRFERYSQERRIHPAYFPAALLTLTFYIWAGGPIFVDESDLAASLEVLDASGRTLGKVDAARTASQAVGFWSPAYALPSATALRTDLVRELLDKITRTLQGGSRE